MPSHPSDQELAEYLNETMDPIAEAAIEEHYLVCSLCIDRLTKISEHPRAVALLPIVPVRMPAPHVHRWASGAAIAAALTFVVLIGPPVSKRHASKPSATPVAVLKRSPLVAQQIMPPQPDAVVSHTVARRGRSTQLTSYYVMIGPKMPFAPPEPVASPEIAEVAIPAIDINIEAYADFEMPLSWFQEQIEPPPFHPKGNFLVRLLKAIIAPFRESNHSD